MTQEEKRKLLIDWIKNIDEYALDDLIKEYLGEEYLDKED